MRYTVTWSGKTGQDEKTVDSAAGAEAWVEQARDEGADSIVVVRGKRHITSAELAAFRRLETAEYKGTL